MFQSLRGFGVGWSCSSSFAASHAGEFQSLRGFGVGWSEKLRLQYALDIEFQSLRGFGVGWSGLRGEHYSDHRGVSIPERVWGWLELHLPGPRPC